MEHKYAQVLRWIADGKKIKIRYVSGETSIANNQSLLQSIAMCGLADGVEFRLAPRTVKVGDSVIEAPLGECEDGRITWFRPAGPGPAMPMPFSGTSHNDSCLLENGRLFASKEAAEAAHAAWVKLMTGGE